MKFEIEIPAKYADKLEEVESIEPSISDQIEIEVLPEVLRLINEAHLQTQENQQQLLTDDEGDIGN